MCCLCVCVGDDGGGGGRGGRRASVKARRVHIVSVDGAGLSAGELRYGTASLRSSHVAIKVPVNAAVFTTLCSPSMLTWRAREQHRSSTGSSWLHFAAPVYSGDDMAHGLHTKLSRRAGRLLWFLKDHEVESVFAVLQLCQCATDALCDWLKLMEGAGLSLIAHTYTHKHKVEQPVTLLLLFWV